MISHIRLRRLLRVVPLIVGAGALSAQIPPPADVPEALRAPAGEQLVLHAHAQGAQIYVCAAAPDGKPKWTLKAPDAELRDERGALIGHHFAGPTWTYRDGSEVAGKAVAHVDSPDAKAIPWLLVTAVSHAGRGVLEHITSIQRLHTVGGAAPPAGQCQTAKPDIEVRSPYSADYYFYAR